MISRTHIALVLTVATASCAERPIDPASVIGHYEFREGGRTETIEVLADGRYIHRYGVPPANRADTARWRLEEHDGPRMMFDDFRDQRGPMREAIPPEEVVTSLWPALIEQGRNGETRFVVDVDPGRAYVKRAVP